MPGDLPTRLFHHPRGRLFFKVAVVVFLTVQAAVLLRRVLPEPYAGSLPWRMFGKTSRYNQSIELSGVTQSGETIPIDATRWFRFRSGAGQHPVITEAPAMWGRTPNKRRKQRVFSRWIAHRVWTEDGVGLTEVWIDKTRVHLHTGRVKQSKRIKIDIHEDDLSRAIPREARVGSQ